MKHKMTIHYDKESDYLEIGFDKPQDGYCEQIGPDLFERRAEKTGKLIGYAIFNVSKQQLHDVEVTLPA